MGKQEHYIWMLKRASIDKCKGRVPISIDSDNSQLTAGNMVTLAHIGGEAPPAEVLAPLFFMALGGNGISKAEEFHCHRKNPWKVEIRHGMSGCRDYRLRILKSRGHANAPIASGIHVSMHNKINHIVRVPLMDLPPLLAAVVADFPFPEPDDLDIMRVQAPSIDGFSDPGAPSGLVCQATELALRVLVRSASETGDNELIPF